MSVLVNRDSKIIVQGFTGGEGTFHAGQMIEYGTNVVGGVTPGKGGQTHLDRPVFNTVAEAVAETGADVSIVFVPPAFAADALMEAADAGIKVIVAITEGIPVADMVKVKAYIDGRDCTLIGPNCPGIITAGQAKVGIMPGFIFEPGVVGIVSKSGTLTYEAVDQCTKAGLGQTTAIGIGGDPIIGTTTLEAVKLLMADDETKGIVMIGEIGGDLEVQAARWIQEKRHQASCGLHCRGDRPQGPDHGPRRGHRVGRGRVGRSQEARDARVRHPRRGQPCGHRLQDGRGPRKVTFASLRSKKPGHVSGFFDAVKKHLLGG